jgi:hypothetical protein
MLREIGYVEAIFRKCESGVARESFLIEAVTTV